jgi:S-adenosylhomocysteine hydrolase
MVSDQHCAGEEALNARLKLTGMGFEIDKLTKEQEKYLASWEMGT